MFFRADEVILERRYGPRRLSDDYDDGDSEELKMGHAAQVSEFQLGGPVFSSLHSAAGVI